MQTQKKTVDLFVDIIDNFGDMGFLMEFLGYFANKFPDSYEFFIVTNAPQKLSDFLARNEISLIYSVVSSSDFHPRSPFAISFFHTNFLKKSYRETLRVDYLSFDDEWLVSHLGEHFDSTPEHRVMEYIVSPKTLGGGLLPPMERMDKMILAKKFGIDASKKWLSIFVYQDTFERMHFGNIDQNFEILLFGGGSFGVDYIRNMRVFPFIKASELYSFFEYSEAIITRGEVSFSQVLQMWRPFLWDMYHEIGGFPTEQSEDFLDFVDYTDEQKFWQKTFWNDASFDVGEWVDFA